MAERIIEGICTAFGVICVLYIVMQFVSGIIMAASLAFS